MHTNDLGISCRAAHLLRMNEGAPNWWDVQVSEQAHHGPGFPAVKCSADRSHCAATLC